MAVGALVTAAAGTLAWTILGRQPTPAIHQSPAPIAEAAWSEGPAAPGSDQPTSSPAPEIGAANAASVESPPPVAPDIARTINLNTASAAQLELLPGIGPALAQRIVEYRAAHGPFRTIEGLDNVKGIGPKTLEKLRPLVSLD